MKIPLTEIIGLEALLVTLGRHLTSGEREQNSNITITMSSHRPAWDI